MAPLHQQNSFLLSQSSPLLSKILHLDGLKWIGGGGGICEKTRGRGKKEENKKKRRKTEIVEGGVGVVGLNELCEMGEQYIVNKFCVEIVNNVYWFKKFLGYKTI